MAYLMQPLKIGELLLNNRLVMPPMATAKAEPDGKVSTSILNYYSEKSKGGYISLIIIEHSFIEQRGKASNQQLSVADDNMVDGLRKLAKVIQANGSKTIMQLNHAGSAANEEVTGSTPIAPSVVQNPRNGNTPRDLTRHEISHIVEAFHNAACRTKEAGFDGVEIHSAHGYLLNQFFSPLTNKRSDEYGGSVLNRIRMHLQVIEAVRAAVGEGFPIFLRLGASDFMDGGTKIEDSQIAAQEFAKAGVDVLDISGGFSGFTVPGLSGQGYFAPLTEDIKKVVSVPVILTGGITKIEAAEKLLEQGKADMIGVGRAILGDSQWAEKAIASLSECQV